MFVDGNGLAYFTTIFVGSLQAPSSLPEPTVAARPHGAADGLAGRGGLAASELEDGVPPGLVVRVAGVGLQDVEAVGPVALQARSAVPDATGKQGSYFDKSNALLF